MGQGSECAITLGVIMGTRQPPPTNAYFDPDVGEYGEWVVVSAITGREYIAPLREDAERCRADDEALFIRHHRVAVVPGKTN